MGKMIDELNCIRLQKILIPENGVCQEPQVYYHEHDDGVTIDFDGYYNLFYIEKHQRYTTISRLFLRLELENVSKIILMHDRDEIAEYPIQDSQSDACYELEYPYNDYNEGVYYFRIVKSEKNKSANVYGYYYGFVEEVRTASIFVDICTYKREAYLVRNMRRLTDFFQRENELRNYIHIGIIDNGRTLSDNSEFKDVTESYQNIKVYPNSNLGGSGGFTRGMKEALWQKEELGLTHILLMDDDASFDAELFVRLFGILRTLKNEYKDITIGG